MRNLGLRRDLKAFQCAECGTEKYSTYGRQCDTCAYVGDWVQPGELFTYEEMMKLGVRSTAELLPILARFYTGERAIIHGDLDMWKIVKIRNPFVN